VGLEEPGFRPDLEIFCGQVDECYRDVTTVSCYTRRRRLARKEIPDEIPETGAS
jgi:hypothetical protein